MKKDIIVAVIIGFLVGSFSAISLVKLPDFIKQYSSPVPQQKPNNISPSTAQVSNMVPKLSIINPADFIIHTSKTASISGETSPGSLIVAESPTETVTAEVTESGNFSLKLKLSEGANTLYLTSYNHSTEAKSVTLTLFYTEEKL